MASGKTVHKILLLLAKIFYYWRSEIKKNTSGLSVSAREIYGSSITCQML